LPRTNPQLFSSQSQALGTDALDGFTRQDVPAARRTLDLSRLRAGG
jgi:hypothetical protein